MANADIIVKIIDQTSAGASSVQRNLNGIDSSGKAVNSRMATFATRLAGVATAIAGAATGGAIFLDTIQTLENRLKLVTTSQQDLNNVFEALAGVAARSRAPLGETVELYARIALAAETVGLNQAEALQVTENFNKVLAISGSTGQEAASAILQFSQALASGTLRGDEFRSITEAAPKLLQILEKQLGVTRGELRDYASKGLLNAELVSRALIEATADLDTQFGKTETTISQAGTAIGNSFLLVVREFDQVTGASTGIANTMTFLAENMETVVGVAGTLAAIVGGVLLSGIVAISAPITATIALIAGVTAAFVAWGDEIYNFFRSIGEFLGFVDAIEEVDEAQAGLTESAIAATENLTAETEAIQQASGAMIENSDNTERLAELTGDLSNEVNNATTAYDDFTGKLERSLELARFDSEEREIQEAQYRALEARAKDLGVAVEELSETEQKQVKTRVRDLITQTQAEEDLQSAREDFATETELVIRKGYEDTTDAITQLEDRKSAYIQEANRLRLDDNKSTQDAILAYDTQIEQARTDLLNEKYREVIDRAEKAADEQRTSYEKYTDGVTELQEALDEGIELSEEERYAYLKDLQDDYIGNTKSEFGSLYGWFEDEIKDFTGLSSREFGILDDTVKLIFGQSISGTIDQVFAGGIGAIQGFGNQGQATMGSFAANTNSQMLNTGAQINSSFASTALGGVNVFARQGTNLITSFASGIFSSLGNMGSWIGNLFSGLFSSVSSGASSLWSGVSGLFGSGGSSMTGGGGGIGATIGGAIGSIFGPVGTALGSIFGGFFADGGNIRPGSFGIVGEAGPEIVTGPAQVFSNSDSRDMMGGGGANVNITINAVDATGIDELLTQRRSQITNMVRLALREDAMNL